MARDYSKLGPTLYKMFEWQGAADGYGAYGFERWEKLHVGPGKYNWSIIDSWLDKQQGKPCAFSVATHLSLMDGWPDVFYDATPPWIYDTYDPGRPTMNGRRVGHIVEYKDKNGNVTRSAIPAYEDMSGPWWKYWREFVMAFGARYDADPRLTAVFGSTGLDMENQATKSPYPDGNTGYRFGQLCTEYIHWLAEAFPTKPTFYVCTIGQGRLQQAQLAGSLGLGVKNNGLLPDMDSHQGYGVFVGSFDPLAWANSNGVPVAIETAHWLSKENMYWAIPACLHYHPVIVDVHSGWFDSMAPEQLEFWRNHVSRTAETAPDAWCVLRDSEYPKRTWTQSGAEAGCSGHTGNWDYYMHMADDADAPRVEDVGPADAPESRQCRRVNSATFTIELAAEPPYPLTIRWLDEPGKELTIGDKDITAIVDGSGSGAWITSETVIYDRQFTVAGNGVAIHMLTATPTDEPEPPAPPEPPEPPIDWTGLRHEAAMLVEAIADLERRTADVGAMASNLANAVEAEAAKDA